MPEMKLRTVKVELEFRVGFVESNAAAVSMAEQALQSVPAEIKSVTVVTGV